jgi:hypothetical protein
MQQTYSGQLIHVVTNKERERGSICTEDAAVPSECNGMCWSLINCVATECAGVTGADIQGCAIMNCGPFLGAATGAMATGMLLPGAECRADCVPAPGVDSGTEDAGE